MKKIGICGHYGNKQNLLNGQTIKTKVLTEELINLLGSQDIDTVDTYSWKQAPFSLLFQCFCLLKNCKNIIILPAHKGVRVFVPLFLILNKVFHRKLHYIVIGGWLPSLLSADIKLKKKVAKLDGVYVETRLMADELNQLGLNNVRLLSNFKRLDISSPDEFVVQTKQPYKLCTFSTVIYEKGIEDAIEAVKEVNQAAGKTAYTLDAYGPIAAAYKEKFERIKKELPEYINYKGVIDYKESINILKDYFILLFPTRHKTEGVPGTIIDAYAAALPVIASKWNSAEEIVIHNKTGYIYEFLNNQRLEETLLSILEDPEAVLKMKPNCIEMAKKYMPDQVIKSLINDLEL